MKIHEVFIFGIGALSLAFASPGVAPSAARADDFGFRFVRVKFNDRSVESATTGGDRWGGRRGRGWDQPWRHDYPTAELNLYEAIERTTKIKIHGEPIILTLNDERIFEHPILYLCEPGYWTIGEEEAQNLREYLLRGGFIIFDDFRSDREWNNFSYQVKRAFPEKEFEEIPNDHPIWSVYYAIDPLEAPALASGTYGRYMDRYFTMKDDNGRMMMVVCYNQDIGDGWEWPNRNYDQASTEAFKMGINFIIWALTH
jgi:hypothetical protein